MKMIKPQGMPLRFCFVQNNLSQKSFDRAFSKARGDLGQRPESRPQARNFSNAVLICAANMFFLLRLLAQKKEWKKLGYVTLR
jgi:hypothetical protein